MNALEELKKVVNITDIKCARIILDDGYGEDYKKIASLKINHTQEDVDKFIDDLADIDYDSGYGLQELFGTVWLKNGDWLERGEYDGSEWWQYCTCPNIPNYLK